MPLPETVARHYADRRDIIGDVEGEGRRLWSQVDDADLAGSWQQSLPRMTVALAGAQVAAASQADGYVSAVAGELNVDADPAGRVQPRSLAGRSADGRSLVSLLMRPVIVAKIGISRGATVDRALAAGMANLALILRTEVADAGRVADGVATAARPTMGYVRQVSPPSCPRCAILAGRWYRYSQGFQRHPGCDCVHVPAPESLAGDLETSPKRLFDEGKIRGLSEADRKAIEEGADINRVVNAHRGMYTAAGGRKLTSERSPVTRKRMRPETIYREATSRSDTIRLLRMHGYIT